MRSIWGEHLMVRTGEHWQQLDPNNLQPLPRPPESQILRLLQDAANQNPQRYGTLLRFEGETAITSTGVALQLDWDTLAITQTGADTRLINTLYRIHYLQWLPSKPLNSLLGLVGIGLILMLVLTGCVQCLNRRKA